MEHLDTQHSTLHQLLFLSVYFQQGEDGFVQCLTAAHEADQTEGWDAIRANIAEWVPGVLDFTFCSSTLSDLKDLISLHHPKSSQAPSLWEKENHKNKQKKKTKNLFKSTLSSCDQTIDLLRSHVCFKNICHKQCLSLSLRCLLVEDEGMH